MPRTPGPGPSGNGRRAKARPPAGDGQFTIRCPSCGTTYHVPIAYAGKRAACTHCGARATLPAPPAVRRAAARLPKGRGRRGRNRPRAGGPHRLHRPRARRQDGTFHALGESLVGDFLPSGLHLDAADPREVAR